MTRHNNCVAFVLIDDVLDGFKNSIMKIFWNLIRTETTLSHFQPTRIICGFQFFNRDVLI